MSNSSTNLSGWVLVLTFLAIMLIIGIFGDLFTFITGLIIMIAVFARKYNQEHLDHL